ncbi:MAG: TonB-dependent receptor [Bacteroidota bacterium]
MNCTTTIKPLRILILFLVLGSLCPGSIQAEILKANSFSTQHRLLTDVLEELGETYQVLFSYNIDLLSDVKVHFSYQKQEALNLVMDRLLETTIFTYETYGDKYFVVFEKTKKGIRDAKKLKRNVKRIHKLENRGNLNISPQNVGPINKIKETAEFITVKTLEKTISGKITNDEGLPLEGATVVAKGTNQGAITNEQGRFQITVADEVSTLIISYIGYAKQEVEIGGRSVIDITMLENASTLEEVVVVGYADQKKVNLTGSVSTIQNKELTQVPLANMSESLIGKAPGLITLQSQGVPGNDLTQLSIRGYDAPLVLVDGIQMDWARIDPNEVESISILKDASAAIYGARAGNGVILITTKRGASGKPTVNYSGNISFQEPTILPQFVESWQFAELLREGEFNQDLNYTYTEADIQKFKDGNDLDYPNTDWHEEMFRHWAPMHTHNVGVRGGTDQVQYYLSAGYIDQASIYKSGDLNFNRYNVRSNVDAKISRHLKLSLDVSFRQELRDQPQTGLSDNWGDLSLARPDFAASIPDPELGAAYAGFNVRSPVAQTIKSYTGFIDDRREYITGRLGLNLKIPGVPGLEANAVMHYLMHNTYMKTQDKPFEVLDYDHQSGTYSSFGVNGQNSLSEETSKFTQLYPMLTLNYDRTFGNHALKGLLISEWIDGETFFYSAGKIDLLSLDLPYLFAGSPENIQATGFTVQQGRISYAGRFNYNYKGKYLLEGTFRFDASHKFPKESRWGFFPSFSAGWRISEEEFMKSAGWIDNLKLRASYSQAGDDDVAAFRFLQGYRIRSDVGARIINERYVYGSTAYRLIASTGLANPDITWLDMTSYNIGLDASFKNGLIGFEFDAFYRVVDNIFGQPLETFPSTFGAELPELNLNSTEDRGFEATLTHRKKINNDFSYSIGAMFSFAREKYREWSEPLYEDEDEIRIFKRTGNRTNRWVGYMTDGIFMSQAEINEHPIDQDQAGNATLRPGDIKYQDLNSDGVIDWRDQDEIGFNNFPDAVYSLNLSVNFKGLSLTTLFQGASLFNHNNQIFPMVNFSKPWDFHYQYRWQPDPNNKGVNINPDAQLPAILGDGVGRSPHNEKFSDFWINDATYLRLRNLNLSYTLPKAWVQAVGFQDIRLTFASSNLLTFSGMGIYKNSIDPEAINGGTSRLYPPVKTIAFGLNLSL